MRGKERYRPIVTVAHQTAIVTGKSSGVLNTLHQGRNITVCAGLANVKYRLGMWDVVQDLFARAYDIQSTQLGPDHPELALTMSHSAGLLRAMNKLADAEIVYRTVGLHSLSSVEL